MATREYSSLFACLFDQEGSAESNGGNPPYSVFRSTQARDREGKPVSRMSIHDFAIIWDADHDERVIYAIERLHLAGLLWPVVLAFESRGVLTLLVQSGLQTPSDYSQLAHDAHNSTTNDVWRTRVLTYNRPSIFEFYPSDDTIREFNQAEIAYVFSIDRQWKLGLLGKPLVELKSFWEHAGAM